MDLSRRSFIRWALGAAAASACPVPLTAQGKKDAPADAPKDLRSETNEVCHQVRDGYDLPLPAPSLKCDVVILGGGPSGLAAADELKGEDFLLLEKEPHLGGNSYTESWEGLGYSTAAAWDTAYDPDFALLAKRWNFDWKEIPGSDSACFDGRWVRDFWNGRSDNPAFERLPYPDSVKKGFRRLADDVQAMDLPSKLKELDERTFAEVLKPYPAPLQAFWDAFGRSNWGAGLADSSAYVGLQAARDWFSHPRYTWEGGIGMASLAVVRSIGGKARPRLKTGCAVYSVRREKGRVLASFFQDGRPATVEAKAAVVAVPKFIARMIVEHVPQDQLDAMASIRYAPFPVYNLCFDRVVYNQGYDNWAVGAKHFTDFIPADWVTNADGGDLKRKQVITVYAPRNEAERADFLDDAKTLAKAQAAVGELADLFPGWVDHLREVRIYRRGHPMPMSTPGRYSRIGPLAGRDLPPVYFAHSDMLGETSDFLYAALTGIAAAKKAAQHL